MKKIVVILLLCYFAILVKAQEKVKLTFADIDRSFTGIQTYKASTPIFESYYSYYYNINDNMITIHELVYQDQEDVDLDLVLIYKKAEVLISKLDIKNINVLGDCNDGFILVIGTKKARENVSNYKYVNLVGTGENLSKSKAVNIRIETEEEKNVFIEKLKSYSK